MKWDCDVWWHNEEWHRWFAWYPARIGDHDCRWLEYIERRYCYHISDFWEYRALETPRDV